MGLLIKNGRVIDPASGLDGERDILIEGEKISKIARRLNGGAGEVIDASGKIVVPGLIDMHAHLREPGREDKETIFSATQAALKGGFTSMLAMPNTEPAIDSAQNIKLLKSLIAKKANNYVLIAAAITRGRRGSEPVNTAEVKKAGALALTDDGASVDDEKVFLKALTEAGKNRIPVICHCEDKALSGRGVVNRGFISTRMGLRGIPAESEHKRVERDIALAAKANAAIHIAHLSCRESVELVARAKKKGLQVTAEVTPHHFSLCEEEVLSFDPNMKMNPPLRSRRDVEALKEGLKSGVIDVIATDHAPHTESEKEIEFERAEFGVIGLETALAAAITALVAPGLLSWQELLVKLTINPAKILGINRGALSAGSIADLAVVSPGEEWLVEKKEIVSKSKNSAFLGRRLKGRVDYTVYCGKIVYRR